MKTKLLLLIACLVIPTSSFADQRRSTDFPPANVVETIPSGDICDDVREELKIIECIKRSKNASELFACINELLLHCWPTMPEPEPEENA